MKLLLDSHILLWSLSAPEKLTPQAREAIIDPVNAVFFSAASVWELELKASKGKLTLPLGWVGEIRKVGFVELKIGSEVAAVSARLPWYHTDPFDRLLVAQAQEHGLTLVSRDLVLASYGATLLAG